MKGKDVFTKREAEVIRALIRERNRADASKQKTIRAKMRRIGFYGKLDWGIIVPRVVFYLLFSIFPCMVYTKVLMQN